MTKRFMKEVTINLEPQHSGVRVKLISANGEKYPDVTFRIINRKLALEVKEPD